MRPDRLVLQLFNAGSSAATQGIRVREINPALAAAGFQVQTIRPFGWPWNPFARMHNAFRGLDPLRTIYVLLRCRNVALVCGHLESCALLLFLRRVFFFRPPILVWEVPWSPGWRYREAVSRLALPRADGAVVFSTSQIELVQKHFRHDLETIFVPFCVDTEFYSPQTRSPMQDAYIWSCGLDEGRDFETILEASKATQARFLIKAGSFLKVRGEQYPNVTFEKGHLPPEEFRKRYSDAAIVIVSTKVTSNASGVTSLMESLAMGRPTIVTDNPALRDYLPPPGAGIVIPVGDKDALRRAIQILLEDPEGAEAMGVAARKYAEERFSRTRHYKEMAKAFDQIIGMPK